jgi:hypothetical protein
MPRKLLPYGELLPYGGPPWETLVKLPVWIALREALLGSRPIHSQRGVSPGLAVRALSVGTDVPALRGLAGDAEVREARKMFLQATEREPG